MAEIPYKNVPPEWRTVVDGIWSDILNDWQASFETSPRGNTALGVYLQDQTTQPIDIFFTEKKGTATTAGEATAGGHTVVLEPGHSIVVGDVIESRTAENFVQAQIVAYDAGTETITVDTPWSRTFPAGVTVGVGNPDLHLAIGSFATPVIFSIEPSAVQFIHITKIIVSIQDNAAMDFTTFGGLAALTNGCFLRRREEAGTYLNSFNWKTNGELVERNFDYDRDSKVGGAGPYAFVSKREWGGQHNSGVVLPLDGALGETLEIGVQDDLTGLTKFRVIAQGHVVQ